MNQLTDWAVFFIDGNNGYHSLRGIGLDDLGRLNYAKVSLKLAGPRTWTGTRYYIGQVQQSGNPTLYAEQRRFLAALRSWDPRITVYLGRLEPRIEESQAAKELRS